MASYYPTSRRDTTDTAETAYYLQSAAGSTATLITVSIPATSSTTVLYNTDYYLPRSSAWGTQTITMGVNVTTAGVSTTAAIAVKNLGTAQTSAFGTALATTATGVVTLSAPSTVFTSGAVTDRLQIQLKFSNSSASAKTVIFSINTATTVVTSPITEFSDVSGVVVPSAQYSSDKTTVYAVGQTTGTDGVSTPLYLEQDVASYGTGYVTTTNFEVLAAASAYSNVATNSTKAYAQRTGQLPTARRGAVMGYDSINKRYIHVGGYDGTTRFADVWEMDANQMFGRQKFVLASTATNAPPGKNLGTSVMVSNGTKSWFIYFSGSNGAADTNDLRILDCTTPGSEAWTLVTQTSAPATRSFNTHHMVAKSTGANTFDIYNFGGFSTARTNDLAKITVDLSGAVPTALTWTTITADGAVGSPARRSGAFCCYDATNDRILVWGGYDGTTYLADVWKYSITTSPGWTQLTASGATLTGRELSSGGWDATNKRIIIFGGWQGSITTDRNDIYQIDFTSANAPVNTILKTNDIANQDQFCFSSGSACVDTNKNLIVEFGQNGYDTTSKYWYAYDISLTGTTNDTLYGLNVQDTFRGRDAPASVYDSDKGLFVMLNGYTGIEDDTTANIPRGDHHNEIWTYDVTNAKLRYANKGFYGMGYKEGVMACYDTTGKRIISFGGITGNGRVSNQIWEHKADAAGNYTARRMKPTGTPPGGRWLGAIVYDSARNRLIIWGGEDATTVFSDMWQVDLSSGDGAWTQLTPTGTVPTAVWHLGFSPDATNKRLYVHGGGTNQAGTTFSSQVWYFDYTAAQPAYTILSPTGGAAYRGLSLTFDTTNNQLLAFGGYDGTNSFQTIRSLSIASPTAWVTATPATSPQARRSHGSFVAAGKHYVIAGREPAGQFFNDVWECTPNFTTLSSSTWANKNPTVYQRMHVSVTGLANNSRFQWQGWASTSSVLTTKVNYSGGANTTHFVTGAVPVSVSDASTITETVNCSAGGGGGPPQISVADSSVLTEAVTMRVTNFISVSDASTLTETITLQAINFIPVSDASTLSETVNINAVSLVSVTDASTLSEAITPLVTSFVSVADASTLSEVITLREVSFVSVSDASALSEVTTANIPVTISVSDSTTVTETLTFNYRAQDIRDDMSNQTVNADYQRWNTFSTNTTISRANGVLTFTTATSTGYAGYTGSTQVNLTGSQVTVQVISIGNQALVSYEIFPIQLYTDANNKLFWYINQGSIQTYKKVAGVQTQLTTVAWDSNAYRFLRIRESSGTTFFERSPDFVTWTVETSLANPIAMAPFWLEPSVGTFVTEASATTAVLDNINTNPMYFTDTVSVAEAVNFSTTNFISVSDSTVVSENIAVFIPGGGIFVSDSSTVSEIINVSIVTTISVSDSTTLTEAIVAAHPVSQLFDDFNDNSQNTSLWVAISGSGKEVETNGQLQISSTVSSTTYGGYKAVRFYDVTGTRIFSQVIDVGNQSIASFQAVPVLLYVDATNSVAWYITANKITAQKQVAGTYTDILATTTYDATIHKFFGIRESAGTTFWDFSTDGISWTNYVSQASPVPINHVQPEVISGTFNAELTATTAIFDNYNIIRDRFVTVTDSTTLTEAITVAIGVVPPLTISVSDSSTLTETVKLLVLSFVSVNDTIASTESLAVNIITFVSVSDSSTLSETVTMLSLAFISVTDASTLSETVTVLTPLYFVSVSDSSVVSEAILILDTDGIGILETITTAETVTVSIPFEQLLVTDSSVVTDTPTLQVLSFVSVSDSSTLSETITATVLAFISVADSATVFDVATIQIPVLISVTDASTLSETTNLTVVSLVNVADSSVLTDTSTVRVTFYLISVNDATALSETVTGLVISFISVTDVSTVSEIVTINETVSVNIADSSTLSETLTELVISFISVADSTTLSESTTVTLGTVPSLSVNVSDSSVVSETVVTQIITTVSVNDVIASTESLSIIELAFVSVSDATTLTEAVNLLVIAFISVTDTSTLSETVVVYTPVYFVSVSDASTVSEAILIQDSEGVAILETVTTAETVTVLIPFYLVTVSDASTVTEVVTIMAQNFVSVSDSSTLSETITLLALNFVSVTDSTTVFEAISVLEATTIFVADSSTVSETININEIALISVSDSSVLTENTTVLVTFYLVSVADSTVLTENNSLLTVSFINVTDSSTLSEIITINELITVNVNDATSVGEALTELVISFVTVNDSTSLSESVAVAIGVVPPDVVNVSDSITVFDAPIVQVQVTVSVSDVSTVSETVSILELAFVSVIDASGVVDTPNVSVLTFISVNDSSTLSETVITYIPFYLITVSDSSSLTEAVFVYDGEGLFVTDASAVSETVTALIPFYLISVSDSSVVTDTPNVNVIDLISVADSSTLSETVTVLIPLYYVSVSDASTVIDTPNVAVVDLVSVADSTVLSESITLVIPTIISVTDSSTLSETVAVIAVSLISVSDSSTLSETVTLLAQNFITVTDASTLTETVTMLAVDFISVSDASTLSETTKLLVTSFVSVSDTSTLTDTPNVYVPFYLVSVSDATALSETVTMLEIAFINVADASTVSETVTATIPTIVSVTDAVAVSETLTELVISFVSVNDASTVSETVTVLSIALISVSDTTALSETVNLNFSSAISVADSIVVSETINETVVSFVSVSDSSSLTDSTNAVIVQSLSVNDSTTVTETITLLITSFVNVSDATVLTETITVQESANLISVSDSATVVDTPFVFINTGGVFIVDTVTVTETVNVYTPDMSITVSDSVTVSEVINATQVYNAMVQPGIQQITGVKIVGP